MVTVDETIRRIRKTQRNVVLVNNGQDGYPAGRIMSVAENSPDGELWFATHASSGKVTGLREDPRTILLWHELDDWWTVHFRGTIEIVDDPETKKRLWKKRWEEIWPGGAKDPDYLLLHFVPESMSYFDNELGKSVQVNA